MYEQKGWDRQRWVSAPKAGCQKLVLDGQAMVEVAVSQDFSAYMHKSQKKSVSLSSS